MKINCKNGVRLLVSDCEYMCCADLRINEHEYKMRVVTSCKKRTYSLRILIDDLVLELRKRCKQKLRAAVLTLFMDSKFPDRLQLQQKSEFLDNQSAFIELATERPRLYYHISTNRFKSQSSDGYTEFKMRGVDLHRIITCQAIVSGIAGGIGSIFVNPLSARECTVIFALQSFSGCFGGITVHCATETDTLPHPPSRAIEIQYLHPYLKRIQSFLVNLKESIKLCLSSRGLFIVSETNSYTFQMFLCNLVDKDEKGCYLVDTNLLI